MSKNQVAMSSNRKTKWSEYKSALYLMQAGDPPLIWDVPSYVTAREYAYRIGREVKCKFTVELVAGLVDRVRVKVTRSS